MDSSQKTSWGPVADWYDTLIDKQSSNYQKDVILPNLLRCLKLDSDVKLLDLACGQGFFTRAFAAAGAQSMGMDISPELVAKAKHVQPNLDKPIQYAVGPAHDLSLLPVKSNFDVITLILAIQNISNPPDVLKACSARMNPKGRLVLVMNHPAFRIPKGSDWGWDNLKRLQYRRVDKYSSEVAEKIQIHPGSDPSAITYSYHRPLQYYVKQLARAGFAVTNLEEWVSNRVSDSGPRALAENIARREIPLFMYIEAQKL